jgi:uncharacterized protein YaiI (UPF0178 family)
VIWIDADAVPRAVREVLVRASKRRKVELTFVANSWQTVPQSSRVRLVVVEAGPDEADNYIVEHCGAGDLVVSADVPLAARAVEQGAMVLQPHGRILDEENVSEVLSLRDFKTELRDVGETTGGPPPFGTAQKERFANALDRWITRSGG